MSHGVLVLLDVAAGSPMTMTGGKPEGGEGCLHVGRELARAGVEVVAGLLKFLGRIGEVRQVFGVGGDEQERSGRLAPAGPDLVLNLIGEAIELGDAGGVVGRDGLEGLGEQGGCQQKGDE